MWRKERVLTNFRLLVVYIDMSKDLMCEHISLCIYYYVVIKLFMFTQHDD